MTISFKRKNTCLVAVVGVLVCWLLTADTFSAVAQQQTPPTQIPPSGSVQNAGQSAPAPVSSQAPAIIPPKISAVRVFSEETQGTQAGQPVTYQISFEGSGFDSLDAGKLGFILFPSTGVAATTVLSKSLDNTKILGQFTAPATYAPQEVALTGPDFSAVVFNTSLSSCDWKSKVTVVPQIVSYDDTKTKYGNGIAARFHVIQLSIVNSCSFPIVVPLAGITVRPATIGNCSSASAAGSGILIALPLDHVTSIYSEDRTLTGSRAIYFNSLLALATLGNAIQPFFGMGFTQAVSILGGGFTTASKQIFVDMSTQQLQNITSQSFGATEQVPASGPIQKFIFIPRNKKCDVLEQNLITGNFGVQITVLPASTEPPGTSSGDAKPTAPAVAAPGAPGGI